ncbi:hypothetical protein [Streptomyces olivochromogenes]|uniref:Uncharacterized protein n=1 Tax=Streptomyces olivochromogenes TaxID=1963 RepID=A0A250VWW4_STROL|nr:hypothetical protein [Streptomyces olivochromogenes]KUN33573.1 hypothetical protein AQJ27_50090 [Streptomyces olivochromogenes]GAX58502.1 hypothetical protein SO3561_10075 [Streptomyces olivochromogenes]
MTIPAEITTRRAITTCPAAITMCPATITTWLCESSWRAATSAVRRPRSALGTVMRASRPDVPGFVPRRVPLFLHVVRR